MDLEHISRIATKAAINGGRVLMAFFGNLTRIDKKGRNDLVTEADLAAEKEIIAVIHEVFPAHGILAEESGRSGGDDVQWVIDPLDGTTNYAHGLGLFSVSIAFCQEQEVKAGVVFNPVSGELFSAIRGRGALLNGTPIAVSRTASLSESLLVTGFPYNWMDNRSNLVQRFSNCLRQAQGVRRLGSAALDLCFVACGRFDGFWEENLKPWDTAAGALIAMEAGARVTDFSQATYHLHQQSLLATNGMIHPDMLNLMKTEVDINEK